MTEDRDMQGKIIITPWSPDERIKDDAHVIEYINAALALGDSDLLGAVLGDVARAYGMTGIAREIGAGPVVLLGTALQVLAELGIKLVAARAEA